MRKRSDLGVSERHKLDVIDWKLLRSMCGVTVMDRCSNGLT